jgi:hypothetical protein
MSVFTGPSVAHWVALRQLARAASAAAGWWHSPIAARRWRGSARDCRGRCRGLIPTAAAAISSQGSGGLYLKRGKLEVAACWPRTLPAPSPPSWSTSRAANSPISRAVRARDRPGADAAAEFAASRQGDRNRRANRANGRTAVYGGRYSAAASAGTSTLRATEAACTAHPDMTGPRRGAEAFAASASPHRSSGRRWLVDRRFTLGYSSLAAESRSAHERGRQAMTGDVRCGHQGQPVVRGL